MHRRLLCPGGAATDGKVCLSLLGTWAGQAWDPAATTLRNVIFDGLQQHILAGVNDRPGEPYYNEPDLPDDPARSVAYNEEARLLTLRGLLHLASRPLDKCAGILGAHLRAHGPALLDRARRENAGADAVEPEPAAEELTEEVRIANRTPLPPASTHMPECASWTSMLLTAPPASAGFPA